MASHLCGHVSVKGDRCGCHYDLNCDQNLSHAYGYGGACPRGGDAHRSVWLCHHCAHVLPLHDDGGYASASKPW